MEEKSGSFLESLIFPLIFVAVMWLFAIVQELFGMDLHWLGVRPRRFEGILGIFFSPLIHSGFVHLTMNSIPFLASGFIMMSVFKSVAFRSFGIIYVLTGILVWAFADLGEIQNSVHIGASGVVYGMVSFILFSGVFVRNRLSIVMALIMVMVFSSGMIQGLSPFQEGISWESHLLGALVGIGVAFVYRSEVKKGHQDETWQEFETTPDAEEEFFLPRDTFEKTKYERQE